MTIIRHPDDNVPYNRFWSKVRVGTDQECWIWKASSTTKGYGQIWIGRRLVLAHRFSYEIHIGEIPDGMHVDHLCHNVRCVNPHHLEAVTPNENRLRQTRRAQERTHCKRGHLLTERNIYRRPPPRENKIECRTCNREDHRALAQSRL